MIGVAKDTAAGAVLVAAIGAVVVGLLLLGPHLWARLLGYRCHRHSAAPHVRPAPKATIDTMEPGFIRPSSIASHSAMGIEAAEVFP